MRAFNRLKSVAGGPAATTLAYDPFGRLDSVTASGATTTFRYGGSQLGGEFNLTPTAWNSRQLRIYLYAGGGETPLLWLEGGVQLSTTLTQTPTWFHADRLGSVVATTNSSGAVTAYAYGPYGEPQTWAGSRFRYTGQLALPEAQLYHYRARAYDPMLGRFLQTDPIGYGDGPNIYAYVHGDPVNGVDPSGMYPCGDAAGRNNCVEPWQTHPDPGVFFDAASIYKGLEEAFNRGEPGLSPLQVGFTENVALLEEVAFKPGGLIIQPGSTPLDPAKLNLDPPTPTFLSLLSTTVSRISDGNTKGLSPHYYNNFPDRITGA